MEGHYTLAQLRQRRDEAFKRYHAAIDTHKACGYTESLWEVYLKWDTEFECACYERPKETERINKCFPFYSTSSFVAGM